MVGGMVGGNLKVLDRRTVVDKWSIWRLGHGIAPWHGMELEIALEVLRKQKGWNDWLIMNIK